MRCQILNGYVYYGAEGQEGKKASAPRFHRDKLRHPENRGRQKSRFTFHEIRNGFDTQATQPKPQYGDILLVEANKTFANIDFRFPPFCV